MCCKHSSTLTIQNANTFVIADHVFAEPILCGILQAPQTTKKCDHTAPIFGFCRFFYVCSANTLLRDGMLHQCKVLVRYKG
jgi:hypothetical protein